MFLSLAAAFFIYFFCLARKSTENKKGSREATSRDQSTPDPTASAVGNVSTAAAGEEASSLDPSAAAAASSVARGSMESRLGQLASLQRRLRSSIPGADLFGELRKSRNSTASVAAATAGATVGVATAGAAAVMTGGAAVAGEAGAGGVDEYLYEYEFSGPGFDLGDDEDDGGYMGGSGGGSGSAAKAIKAAEEAQAALQDEIADLQEQLVDVKNELANAKANAKRTLREVCIDI